MLRGQKIGLRAREESDVAILHNELYGDVLTRSRADSKPWRPIRPESPLSPFAVSDPDQSEACFSVVELATDELAGDALLSGFDHLARSAHLGMSLRPGHRGRGLGADVVAQLCFYGFAVRGLHRLQIDTLADNLAMRQVAERAGFRLEGTLLRSAWVVGQFVDEVIYGLLLEDWPGVTP